MVMSLGVTKESLLDHKGEGREEGSRKADDLFHASTANPSGTFIGWSEICGHSSFLGESERVNCDG